MDNVLLPKCVLLTIYSLMLCLCMMYVYIYRYIYVYILSVLGDPAGALLVSRLAFPPVPSRAFLPALLPRYLDLGKFDKSC